MFSKSTNLAIKEISRSDEAALKQSEFYKDRQIEVERIKDSITRREKINVYGDFGSGKTSTIATAAKLANTKLYTISFFDVSADDIKKKEVRDHLNTKARVNYLLSWKVLLKHILLYLVSVIVPYYSIAVPLLIELNLQETVVNVFLLMPPVFLIFFYLTPLIILKRFYANRHYTVLITDLNFFEIHKEELIYEDNVQKNDHISWAINLLENYFGDTNKYSWILETTFPVDWRVKNKFNMRQIEIKITPNAFKSHNLMVEHFLKDLKGSINEIADEKLRKHAVHSFNTEVEFFFREFNDHFQMIYSLLPIRDLEVTLKDFKWWYFNESFEINFLMFLSIRTIERFNKSFFHQLFDANSVEDLVDKIEDAVHKSIINVDINHGSNPVSNFFITNHERQRRKEVMQNMFLLEHNSWPSKWKASNPYKTYYPIIFRENLKELKYFNYITLHTDPTPKIKRVNYPDRKY